MKLIFIAVTITLVSAFIGITPSEKGMRIQQLQKYIDSVNTQTRINQELFKIKIQQLKTN